MTYSSPSASGGISVILAIYNEEANLPGVLAELKQVLSSLNLPFEVIGVNDGSADRSASLLAETSRSGFPELRWISFRSNHGQSAAFAAGIRAARFPWVVTMDADGQNDPADLPGMLEAVGDADICCGYRAERRDTWSRRMASRIGNGVRRRMLESEVLDTGCSLKLFRRSALEGIPAWHGMHRFLPDLSQIYHQTRMVQVPVHHRPRLKGFSKYSNLGRLIRTLPDVLAVRWMKNRSFRVSSLEMEEGPDVS